MSMYQAERGNVRMEEGFLSFNELLSFFNESRPRPIVRENYLVCT